MHADRIAQQIYDYFEPGAERWPWLVGPVVFLAIITVWLPVAIVDELLARKAG